MTLRLLLAKALVKQKRIVNGIVLPPRPVITFTVVFPEAFGQQVLPFMHDNFEIFFLFFGVTDKHQKIIPHQRPVVADGVGNFFKV